MWFVCLARIGLCIPPIRAHLRRLSWFKDLEYVINIQTALSAPQNISPQVHLLWEQLVFSGTWIRKSLFSTLQPEMPIQSKHSQSLCYTQMLSTVITTKTTDYVDSKLFACCVTCKNDKVSVRVAWSRLIKNTTWRNTGRCRKIRQEALWVVRVHFIIVAVRMVNMESSSVGQSSGYLPGIGGPTKDATR